MSESGPPRRPNNDATQALVDGDLVEMTVDEATSVSNPQDLAGPEDDGWFVDEPPPRKRRENTLDAFLTDLADSEDAAAPPPVPPAAPTPPTAKAAASPPKPAADSASRLKSAMLAKPEPAAHGGERPVFVLRPPSTTRPPAPAADGAAAATDDELWQREVEALAPTLPTRAAMLQAFRARLAVDVRGDVAGASALCVRAKTLAPDARCVAMTARWISSVEGDPVKTIATARAELPLAGDASERLALLWQIATLQATAVEPTLREILELDPQDTGAWLALAASASQHRHWPVAAEAWEALAGRTGDAVARAACYATAAGLRDELSQDLAGARSVLDRALEADPASPAVYAGLQSIFLRQRAASDVARVVGLEAQRFGDLDPGLSYHEHAGDLMWECQGDANAAAPHYERAATLVQSDVVPLGKLAAIYEQEGRYPELATIYERLLERLQDPARRGAVLHRLASVYETRLDRADEAVRCYRAALDAAPTLAPAAQALAQLYQAQRRWNEAGAVLLAEVDRVGDSSLRAARYVAIAELLEPHLGAGPQVVALLERALALDPSQTAALDALDRIYRGSARWDDIIKLHEAQLAQTSHPLRARALRLSLAALYLDRAGAPDKAAEQLRAALTGAPNQFFPLVQLARALAEAGKWTEHVAILEQQAKSIGDGLELVATLYRIATVVESRLGDPARALASYRRVLDSQPRHELALHAMLRILRGLARWEEVIATERRLLTLTERPEEAAVIQHRIALVAEDQLARHDDAIEAYEAALRALPSYRPARVALEHLLRAADRFDRLASLLEDQAAAAAGADRARLLCQAALVRELHQPGESEAAARLYEEALAAEPALPTALWGRYRIGVAASDWKTAASALGLLVRQARHPAMRARLLVQLARIHELRLADHDRALELLNAALTTDPAPSTVFERLRLALAHRADAPRWLGEAARVTTDPATSAGLLRLRASLVEAEGGDAAGAYGKALGVAPTAAVLDGLIRNVKGGVLAEALVLRARLVKDAPTRALLFAVAGALHARGDAADAAYREALEAQPDFMPAIAGRRVLAEEAGDWRAAAALCTAQAVIAADAANKVELFEQAAQLFERHGDAASAIARYQDALAAEPGRRTAVDRALALIGAGGDWGAAVALIGDHVAAVRDDAARAELLAKRGRILAEQLGDAEGAIADIERALAIQPADPELLLLLASLHESISHWADAAGAYDRLAKTGDANQRKAALMAEARIWTSEVPDPPRARKLLEAARELAPSDRDVVAALADAAIRAGDQKGAVELFDDLAQHGGAVERAGALLAGLALRERLGAPGGDDVIATTIELAFQDAAVIPLLEAHYREQGDLDPFVTAVEAALAKRSPAAPETAGLQISIGRLFAREPSPSSRAIRFLKAAIAATPEDVLLHVSLGGALAGTNATAALAALRRAIELDPSHPAAYQRLAALCTHLELELAASLASSAAALLGDDNALARRHVELVAIERPSPGALPPDDALSIVVGPSRAVELRGVIEILDPYLHLIFPDDQRKLAATTAMPRAHAGIAEIRKIAEALGAPSIAIQFLEAAEPTIFVSDPRAFVLAPEYAADDALPRLRFDAGSALARIAAGSTLGVLPADDVRSLLLALTDPDARDDRDLRRRVAQALPRRARKDLERLVEEEPIDEAAVTTWAREEEFRATRIGVLACCDFAAVARSICPTALAAPTPDERRARIRTSLRMLDALRFGVSDACWTACRRLYGRG